MIIKIHKAGRSFKGVSRYLTHDAKAETTRRVAWTKTLNLSSDDIPSGVDEMLWTFRSADLLKRQAGVSTSGSKLGKPVRHISVSWPQGETPSPGHMAETVQAYLKFMGWQDRQAIMVAHNDTEHAHVHVVLNSVSPQDGRALKNSHDYRRSENFALTYEREQGQIHCAQRLKERKQRDKTPTRETWQRFKGSEKDFERDEARRMTATPDYFERKDMRGMNRREWEALKSFQRKQRERFFVEGKEAYSAARKEAFRKVREEFRPQWNAFYAAKGNAPDRGTLAQMKQNLIKAQNKAIEEERKQVCDKLREQRDEAYRAMLAQQKVDRHELGLRQMQGLRTYAMMDVIYPAPSQPDQTREPVTERNGMRWRTARSDDDQKADRRFAVAGAGAVDPIMKTDTGKRPPAFTVREQAGPEKTIPSLRPAEAHPPKERSEATVEKERIARAREMTDREAETDQREEAAVLRASWSRRRGSRGRRD